MFLLTKRRGSSTALIVGGIIVLILAGVTGVEAVFGLWATGGGGGGTTSTTTTQSSSSATTTSLTTTTVITSLTTSTSVVSGTSTTTITSTVSSTSTYSQLQVSMTPSASTMPIGQPFTFTANAPTATSPTFYWVFGDGSSAGGPQVSHAYASSGTFNIQVQMQAQNGYGSSSVSVSVTGIASSSTSTVVTSTVGSSTSTTTTIGVVTAPLVVNVISSYDNSQLSGATVSVAGPVSASGTASGGQYIQNLPVGTYTVSASYPSYNTGVSQVTLTASGAQVTIALTYACGRQICPQSITGIGALIGFPLELVLAFVIGIVGAAMIGKGVED